MVSAVSTVTTLLSPDTVTDAQWPVIATVLEMPLTVMALSLQAMVLFSLMPETMTDASAGAVAEDGGPVLGAFVLPLGAAGPCVLPPVAVVADARWEDGLAVTSSWESCRAAYAAIPPTNTSTARIPTAARIQNQRKPDDDLGVPPGYGLL